MYLANTVRALVYSLHAKSLEQLGALGATHRKCRVALTVLIAANLVLAVLLGQAAAQAPEFTKDNIALAVLRAGVPLGVTFAGIGVPYSDPLTSDNQRDAINDALNARLPGDFTYLDRGQSLRIAPMVGAGDALSDDIWKNLRGDHPKLVGFIFYDPLQVKDDRAKVTPRIILRDGQTLTFASLEVALPAEQAALRLRDLLQDFADKIAAASPRSQPLSVAVQQEGVGQSTERASDCRVVVDRLLKQAIVEVDAARITGETRARAFYEPAGARPDVLVTLVRLGGGLSLSLEAPSLGLYETLVPVQPPRCQLAVQGSDVNARPADTLGTAPARQASVFPALAGQTFKDCSKCPLMTVIPAGTFMMGSQDGDDDERPLHRVEIRRPFAMGVYEVTFAQWHACVADGYCRENKSPENWGWGAGERPVINVSWAAITAAGNRGFITWLNSKVDRSPYRLPSEAEWEYAARAGSTGKFWWGDQDPVCQQGRKNGAVQKSCSSKGTRPVGFSAKNGFGLYDVHGNVWEWVQDCWQPSYKAGPATEMAAKDDRCEAHVLRGGSWLDTPDKLRSASRGRFTGVLRFSEFSGFRVAKDLD